MWGLLSQFHSIIRHYLPATRLRAVKPCCEALPLRAHASTWPSLVQLA